MRRAHLQSLVGLAMLALCSQTAVAAKPKSVAPSAPVPAWPAPPAEPSVVFRQIISRPSDIGAKSNPFKGLSRWLTGANDQRELIRPFGLSLDDEGRLLVTDTGANVVCCIDVARKQWLRFEQVGSLRFKSPVAVAAHAKVLYVADSGLGKVIAFTDKGKLLFELSENLERPTGLVIVGERLLVADAQRHHVARFSLRGQPQGVFGHRGSGAGEFNFPTHLAGDSAGQVYVTDSLNSRVQVFDSEGRFLRVIGSEGDRHGQFTRPKGVAVDRLGHCYIVDALGDNVRMFDAQSRLLLSCGEAGSGPGQFWLPNGIAVGRDDTIYVADSYNRRIQVLHYTGKP